MIRKEGQGGAMAAAAVYIGMDVSKATLDICASDGETWQAANDDSAMETLCTRIAALHPTLIVLEATGGYELRAAAALAAAGLPVAVVNPRQVRLRARSGSSRRRTASMPGSLPVSPPPCSRKRVRCRTRKRG
jgi:transposase